MVFVRGAKGRIVEITASMIRLTDATGKTAELSHDLDAQREVVTDRLGFTRILEYDPRGNVVRETDELGHVVLRTLDTRDRLLSQIDARVTNTRPKITSGRSSTPSDRPPNTPSILVAKCLPPRTHILKDSPSRRLVLIDMEPFRIVFMALLVDGFLLRMYPLTTEVFSSIL